MKKGFTLIEVLISLVILSIIAIVSTNFLQSSIDLRNQSKSKVDDIKVFNLGVSTIRRDLMSVVNLPMRDNFGNQLPNFIGSNADKKITFLGFINRIDSSRSSISRIEYLFDDTKFIRRVYFTADPYDYDDYIDSVIFNNIDDVEISFLIDNRWFTEWPAGQTAAYMIPKLVKIEINDKDRDFEIIINPNIDYVYRQ
ncbi:MAG: type II secretion system protein GspJ [Gammaproteobacteria bacterium]|tara:strand:+ start:3441 stop:4031 length:591 start_codon:yes stop_codon:yes gene_type:complete